MCHQIFACLKNNNKIEMKNNNNNKKLAVNSNLSNYSFNIIFEDRGINDDMPLV